MIDVAKAESVVASCEQALTPWTPDTGGRIVRVARELLEEVKRLSPAPANGARMIVFRTPESIVAALKECPRLGAVPRLKMPDYWQAQLRAYERVDFAVEIRKAEAWLVSNGRRSRTDLARFLHNWFAIAASHLPPEEE